MADDKKRGGGQERPSNSSRGFGFNPFGKRTNKPMTISSPVGDVVKHGYGGVDEVLARQPSFYHTGSAQGRGGDKDRAPGQQPGTSSIPRPPGPAAAVEPSRFRNALSRLTTASQSALNKAVKTSRDVSGASSSSNPKPQSSIPKPPSSSPASSGLVIPLSSHDPIPEQPRRKAPSPPSRPDYKGKGKMVEETIEPVNATEQTAQPAETDIRFVKEAMPLGYWAGRYVTRNDLYHNECLKPENLQYVLADQRLRTNLDQQQQPQAAQAAPSVGASRPSPVNDTQIRRKPVPSSERTNMPNFSRPLKQFPPRTSSLPGSAGNSTQPGQPLGPSSRPVDNTPLRPPTPAYSSAGPRTPTFDSRLPTPPTGLANRQTGAYSSRNPSTPTGAANMQTGPSSARNEPATSTGLRRPQQPGTSTSRPQTIRGPPSRQSTTTGPPPLSAGISKYTALHSHPCNYQKQPPQPRSNPTPAPRSNQPGNMPQPPLSAGISAYTSLHSHATHYQQQPPQPRSDPLPAPRPNQPGNMGPPPAPTVPSATSTATITQATGGGGTSTSAALLKAHALLNASDDSRSRRSLAELESFCTTPSALDSLHSFRDDYARRNGREWLIPQSGSAADKGKGKDKEADRGRVGLAFGGKVRDASVGAGTEGSESKTGGSFVSKLRMFGGRASQLEAKARRSEWAGPTTVGAGSTMGAGSQVASSRSRYAPAGGSQYAPAGTRNEMGAAGRGGVSGGEEVKRVKARPIKKGEARMVISDEE